MLTVITGMERDNRMPQMEVERFRCSWNKWAGVGKLIHLNRGSFIELFTTELLLTTRVVAMNRKTSLSVLLLLLCLGT